MAFNFFFPVDEDFSRYSILIRLNAVLRHARNFSTKSVLANVHVQRRVDHLLTIVLPSTCIVIVIIRDREFYFQSDVFDFQSL